MKKLAIISLVITLSALTLLLIGCGGCDGSGEPQDGLPPWFDVDNVRLYSIDPNTFETDYIEIHSSEVIGKMYEINGILIDDFWIEDFQGLNRLIINLNAEAEQTSLQGSTGAAITTDILIRTFSSFPNIDGIEILIDGETKYGDHFDFFQTFLVSERAQMGLPQFTEQEE